MKSLKESLFDDDLVTRETGYEKLYGLVERAKYFSISPIDYLDKSRIKREYNRVTRKYEEKQWKGTTGYNRMDKIHYDPTAETLRELIYVIVCNIDTCDVIDRGELNLRKLEKEVLGLVFDYLTTNISNEEVLVSFQKLDELTVERMYHLDGDYLGIRVYFKKPVDGSDDVYEPIGNITLVLRKQI